MDDSFYEKKIQKLVLFQSVMHRSRPAVHPVAFQKTLNYPAGTPLSPPGVNPGVKRISEKVQHRVFYHSLWWPAIHLDKGLAIDLFV
jgi:hypothetical protein